MDKLHYLFFTIAVIALFIGGFALASVQSAHDKIDDIEIPIVDTFDWRTDKDFWKFVNDNYISERELNATKKEIKAYATLNKDSIVAIKEDIKSKFPQASTVEEEEQTAISQTPFLTLTMEKSEWTVGATLIFTGTATPHDLVSITVKLPDRTLLYGQAVPADIINGVYRIEVITELDHVAGFWTVFAKQGKEQSATLTFKVE